MTETIIEWAKRHYLKLILAGISFASGVATLDLIGKSALAMLAVLVAWVIATVALLLLIDLTEKGNDDGRDKT
jgi:hypothetical protein